MTYWNEIEDSHVRFWGPERYQSYYKIKDEMNVQGYRGDILQSSDILYLGSCDVMSSIPDNNARWPMLLHNNKHLNHPFIALATVGSGLPSMVRRLYSYIQNFGAPKLIYMTVPRFDGHEFVNKSGKCYNVSSRIGSANYCKKVNLIDDEELAVWLAQLAANRRLNNPHNTQYILEERFAFIETLCKAHNMKLKWTFNPSDAGIAVLYRNLPVIEHISDFMKASFVGIPEIKDQLFDRTIGPETHLEIYNKFIGVDSWDFSKISTIAESNFNWMKEKYGIDLIKMEE